MVEQLSYYEAVIYDMDGVLTDSEPLWKIAMEDCFSAVGCPLTRKDFQKTTGLRIDEVIRYWFNVAPWKDVTPEELQTRIIQRMVELLREQAQPLTGVRESLEYFKCSGKKIGLATSSHDVLINVILDSLNIRSYFNVIRSAEHETYGKPHPAVYLTTARRLDVNPLRCLVIEDSLNGVISAKAARMTVICIPEKTHTPEPKLIVADKKFDNLLSVITYFQS